MFCPRCSTENNSELKYCRNCGQNLSSVRLVLEGRVDQAIATLSHEQKLSVYRVRIGVSVFLILTALATLLTGGWIGFRNVASAAILLIITLILFLHLVVRSRRVARLLNPEAESKEMADQLRPADSSLTEAGTAALQVPVPKTPSSVAESTTLKLNSDK